MGKPSLRETRYRNLIQPKPCPAIGVCSPMKGQYRQTPQSTRSSSFPSSDCNPRTCHDRFPQQELCVAFFCALFIAMGFSIEHRVIAAESTNSPRQNSIIVPTGAASDGNLLVISPSTTNNIRQDGVLIGSANISDLHEMLQLYADARNRIVLSSTNLSNPKLNFSADKPLTSAETVLVLDAVFGLNGIAMIDIGEKWVKAVPSAGCQTSGNGTHQPEYLTHLEHLSYLKPSELIPILQTFSSGAANAVMTLDAEQVVLLRDFPQNVERMQKALRELDVAPPIEFLSEVIPAKYAKASDITGALETLRTNGVGKSALLERMDKRLRSARAKFNSNQVKLIADERTNSLLVYAGGEDMERIKEMIFDLDTVAAQILIEAVIIEMNRDAGSKLTAIADRKLSWMTNFVSEAVTNSASATEANYPPNSAGMAGTYRFALITNDLDSVVLSLETNSSARILQRPRIQTSDGEPATLFVGESRPYPSGSYTCGWEYSSIQAINQGVTLEVTPSIISNGFVALNIHQTIEETNGSVTMTDVGDVPITHRTESNLKAMVSDRSVIVLDGSLARTNAPTRPGAFKRILTLNGLFHHSKTVSNHNELIVLLRPTILPAPEVAQLSKTEKDKMPGVRRTEPQTQSEAANRLKQLDEKLKRDRDLNSK